MRAGEAIQGYCVTLNAKPNLLERLPDVPPMVIVDAPVGVEPLVFRVNLLVEVAGLVLKVAVTPLGKPQTLRVTA